MNTKGCIVIEEENPEQFSDAVSYAMSKGYKISSSNIIHNAKKIMLFAIMIKENSSVVSK